MSNSRGSSNKRPKSTFPGSNFSRKGDTYGNLPSNFIKKRRRSLGSEDVPVSQHEIKYKGKILKRTGRIKAGKNRQNKWGGTYAVQVDGKPTDEVSFVKQPQGKYKPEIFTESFFGKLIIKLKEMGIIEKEYHDAFTCADLVQLPDDHGYALIQPFLKNLELLFKVVHTNNQKGNDRSTWYELYRRYCSKNKPGYSDFTKNLRAYDNGLAIIIVWSLAFGDYSLHSGNVGVIHCKDNQGNEYAKFTRIDLGACGRNLFTEENNKNIFKPKEYQDNIFALVTKEYLVEYEKIDGLFDAVSEEAEKVRENLQNHGQEFINCISNVLSEMNPKLINKEDRAKLKKIFGMSGDFDVELGDIKDNPLKKQKNREFAGILLNIVLERLVLIQTMNQDEKFNNQEPRKSVYAPSPTLGRKTKLSDVTEQGAGVKEEEAKKEEARKEKREKYLIEVFKKNKEKSWSDFVEFYKNKYKSYYNSKNEKVAFSKENARIIYGDFEKTLQKIINTKYEGNEENVKWDEIQNEVFNLLDKKYQLINILKKNVDRLSEKQGSCSSIFWREKTVHNTENKKNECRNKGIELQKMTITSEDELIKEINDKVAKSDEIINKRTNWFWSQSTTKSQLKKFVHKEFSKEQRDKFEWADEQSKNNKKK